MTMKRDARTGKYVSTRNYGDPPDPETEAQIAELQRKLAEADARAAAQKQAEVISAQARTLIEAAGLKPDDPRLAPVWQHGATPQGLAALQAVVELIAPPGQPQPSATANRADTLAALRTRFAQLRGSGADRFDPRLHTLLDDARKAGFGLGDLN